MRESKFKYTVIKGSGHVMNETFPMGDIENGRVIQWMKSNHISDDTCEIYRTEFTGLLDKNGKEIYEGDIVRVGDYDEGVWIDDDVHSIKYQGADGYPAFELTPHPGHEMNGLAYVFQSGEQDIEVIGNIHENHELLEKS